MLVTVSVVPSIRTEALVLDWPTPAQSATPTPSPITSVIMLASRQLLLRFMQTSLGLIRLACLAFLRCVERPIRRGARRRSGAEPLNPPDTPTSVGRLGN